MEKNKIIDNFIKELVPNLNMIMYYTNNRRRITFSWSIYDLKGEWDIECVYNYMSDKREWSMWHGKRGTVDYICTFFNDCDDIIIQDYLKIYLGKQMRQYEIKLKCQNKK